MSLLWKSKKTSHKIVKKLTLEHFLEKKLKISSTLIQLFSRFVFELSQFDFNGKFQEIDFNILKRCLNSFEFINSSFYKLKNFYIAKYPSVLNDIQEYNGVVYKDNSKLTVPLKFYK